MVKNSHALNFAGTNCSWKRFSLFRHSPAQVSRNGLRKKKWNANIFSNMSRPISPIRMVFKAFSTWKWNHSNNNRSFSQFQFFIFLIWQSNEAWFVSCECFFNFNKNESNLISRIKFGDTLKFSYFSLLKRITWSREVLDKNKDSYYDPPHANDSHKSEWFNNSMLFTKNNKAPAVKRKSLNATRLGEWGNFHFRKSMETEMNWFALAHKAMLIKHVIFQLQPIRSYISLFRSQFVTWRKENNKNTDKSKQNKKQRKTSCFF